MTSPSFLRRVVVRLDERTHAELMRIAHEVYEPPCALSELIRSALRQWLRDYHRSEDAGPG